MRHSLLLSILVVFCLPLVSFSDFITYWTVELNDKIIYDSRNEIDNRKLFDSTFSLKDIKTQDSLKFEIFNDNECINCIHNYFITEFTHQGNIVGSYLMEQKSFGPTKYKVALWDIYHCGSKSNIKSVHWFVNGEKYIMEIARIKFR